MKNIDGLFTDNGFDGIVVLIDEKLTIQDVNIEFGLMYESLRDPINIEYPSFLYKCCHRCEPG